MPFNPYRSYMAKLAVLGQFEDAPQPPKPRSEVKDIPVLTPDEVLHKIMLSKNHQHHLGKRAPEEREKWLRAYKGRWVGSRNFHLVDLPLAKLRNKQFNVNPEAVAKYVKDFPKDRYAIIGQFPDPKTPHVILDGNHLVAAARERGHETIRAYVPEHMINNGGTR